MMNDQLVTQHFILWQCPVSLPETHFARVKPRQVRAVEAGYEYDEQELAEELASGRQRQPQSSPVQVEPGDFEAAYQWFLS
jgi:hypothetical protein